MDTKRNEITASGTTEKGTPDVRGPTMIQVSNPGLSLPEPLNRAQRRAKAKRLRRKAPRGRVRW